MKFKSDIEVQAGLRDGGNDIGTAGQILSSTGSQTNWIDQSSIVASEAKLVFIECKNTSGGTISKGTPVYQTGTVGATDVIEVGVADASDENKMAAIGLLQTDLANNAFGKVVITGELLNITTSPIDGVTPVAGDTIYVKSGGGLTLTKPTGVNFIQNIGLVGKVSGGSAGSITVSSIMRSNDVPTPLYIDHTNQRLGIGIETPDSTLHIAGDSTAVPFSTVLKVESTANEGSVKDIHIYNQYDRDIGIKFETLGGENYIWQDSNGDDALILSSGGSNRTADATLILEQDHDVLIPNGNVGIGTTSPGYRLEVDGGIGDGVKIKAGNAASKDSLLVSTNNDVSKFLVQGDGKVIINSSTGISGRTENFQVFGKQIITNTGTDGPVLYLGYNSSGSNTIQLGRGRTADGLSYMDFNGEVMSAGQFGFRIIRYSGQNASTELNHIGTGAFKLTCTNSADIILNPNSGSVGISQTNPSHKLDVTGDGRFTSTVTATNFILSSDERLKENVEKVCDNRVEADWKTFELKTDKGQKRYGVIAQELEKTNPEFVREDSQGFKSVAYIDLLIAKIAELEARLEKLEK